MTTDNPRTSFDIDTLADKTIEMLDVAAGHVIWIWASTHSLNLIEALAYRIRSRGAFWTLRLAMPSLRRRLGLHAPEECLPIVPEHELRWLSDITAIIDISDHKWLDPDISLARGRAMAAEWIALIDEAAQRGCRRVAIKNPTPALAASYGISVETLRERYWAAINIDYAALDKEQERVTALLEGGKSVHITSPLGTDLRLRIDGRPVLLDTDSLPRGEVYVAPHEDSADGVAIIDCLFLKGKPAERVRLTFEQGRVVEINAPDARDADAFREVLAAASGAKDVIAEFAIGLNPGITEPVGDVMLDEKIGGSAHIAIGMNKNFGGRNKSNLHKDMVILRPTIRLDGTIIMDHGVFLQSIDRPLYLQPDSPDLAERAR